MPRVHHRKARKDYPDHGIKKGDMYYTWDLKTGPYSSYTGRSLTPPQPEQLTTSGYLQQWYPIQRDIGKFNGGLDELTEIVQTLEELRDEEQEKLDNMPQGLQEGPTGEIIQERIEDCEGLINDLQSCEAQLDSEDEDEIESAREEIQGLAQ